MNGGHWTSMQRTGDSGRKIAHYLGRSVSTLRREWLAAYPYHQAHELRVRRQQSYLGASPAATANHRVGCDPISVASDRQAGGSLFRFLCHQGRRYRYRSGSSDYRRTIPERRGSEHRPPVVEERKYLGDWEADTMHGARHQGALVTVVERTSRLVLAAAVDHRDKVRGQQALVRLLHGVAKWVKTITFDNGREFSGHQFIAQQLHCHTYFARPYHSWERATNENTNGLLRRHFPKKQSLRGIAPTQVRKVVDQLNHRPRKCLGFRTPAEVFEELSGRDYNLATGIALTG